MPINSAKYDYHQDKRFLILRVYEILSDYTDFDHHIKKADIVRKLEERYGLIIERKTVYQAIKDLKKFGKTYGIEIVDDVDGVFLACRRLDKAEIAFLIDSIFSSKSIGQKDAQNLIEKLQGYLSKYERKNFNYIVKSGEVNRTNNKENFYNIELLLEAIEKGKKVQFNYNRFYVDALQNEKKKNRRLVASPYYLVNNQGKYYLVCNNNYFDDIANYRVDRMSNVEVLEDDRKPLDTIKDCKNFDVVKYANENIYMFSNDTVDAKVRIDSEYSVSYVQDWFGKNANIFIDENDCKIYARIHSNEQALIYWCLQYGENIELVEPASTRKKIKEIIDKMKKNYK